MSATDNMFKDMPYKLREDLIEFYSNAIKEYSPREDYKDLLQLRLVFLGGSQEEEFSFRSPGEMLQPRWMAKAISSLKIFVLKD